MIRKLLPFLLLAALFLALASTASAGSPGATLTVTSGSGDPGDTVSVPVSLASEPGAQVAIVGFDLRFDTSQLSYGEVEAGAAALAASKVAQGNLIQPNTVRV